MSKVILDMTVSLDGYIAGPNGSDAGLHNWYFSPAPASAEVIAEIVATTGAIIMGRRTYDLGDQQDGFADNPYPAMHVVLTRQAPTTPAKGSTTFVFVTDGVDSALLQARAAAGDKSVVVGGGADVAQQYLRAGLVDEIQLHMVPVLLGKGVRLFENIGSQPIQLENIGVVESRGVRHLKYRIIR